MMQHLPPPTKKVQSRLLQRYNAILITVYELTLATHMGTTSFLVWALSGWSYYYLIWTLATLRTLSPL